MFIVTRIVNGIVAGLALMLCLALLVATSSNTLLSVALWLALVAALFVGDLFLRKRQAISDTVFAGIWTALFLYAFYTGFSIVQETVPAELGEALFFWLLLYGLPLTLNGIYLSHLLLKKKSVA